MGFRFRRTVKIAPGIRLNFGKKSISTSIGVRGAQITKGTHGTRVTVGLPGTGVSYTEQARPRRDVALPSVDAADSGSSGKKILRGIASGLFVVAKTLTVVLGGLVIGLFIGVLKGIFQAGRRR